MSAEPGGETPVEPGSSPRRLSGWVTGVALGVLGVLAVLVFWPAPGLDTLERPERSLERVVTRDMDFRAAARAAPAWERRLYALTFSSASEARAAAIDWYDELVRAEGAPLAELHRLILLAEDGQTESVQSALAAWTPGDEWADQLAALGRMAYGTELASPRDLRSALAAVRRELPAGWFADRLAARLAARLGDASAAAETERATAMRGTRLLWRIRAILAGETLLVVLGVAALAPWVAAPGFRAARVALAQIPPAWSAAEGIGLFARGAVGLVGVAVLWPFLPGQAWSTVLVVGGLRDPDLGVPPLVLRLVVDELRRGVRASSSAWGAGEARPGHSRAGEPSTLTDVLLEFVGERLGVETHWTDGFQERLVWGTPSRGGRGSRGQLRRRAARRGGALPRRALRDAADPSRAAARDPRQRRAVRAGARLRGWSASRRSSGAGCSGRSPTSGREASCPGCWRTRRATSR